MLREEWIKYLEQLEENRGWPMIGYIYPVTDEVTTTHLQQQDQNKQTMEQSLISELLQEAWRVAVDFGCGTGANFFLFDGHRQRKSLLVGLDPDCERLEWARQTADYQLMFVQSYTLCGGVEILENIPDKLKADVVLCSQVLGHVSEEQTQRIIKGFHRILTKKGRCGIAIPIIGEAFKENPQAEDWSGKEDFTHLVDMAKSPGDRGFRRQITLEEFNRAADKPETGLLPVRSFLVPEFPNPLEIKLPCELSAPPPTIAHLIKPLFDVEKSTIYSIHKDPGSPIFPIGDLFIQLGKK